MIFLECMGSRASLSANPRRQEGAKYSKFRKIKVLRNFLFLFSDTRKIRKSPVWTVSRCQTVTENGKMSLVTIFDASR